MADTNTKNDSAPRFYERDKRWLVSHDKAEPLSRGDVVEVRRSNGTIRIVVIQDEVVVNPGGKGKKRFYLMKDETELHEQGYRPSSMVPRYRALGGSWRGWGVDQQGEDDD